MSATKREFLASLLGLGAVAKVSASAVGKSALLADVRVQGEVGTFGGICVTIGDRRRAMVLSPGMSVKEARKVLFEFADAISSPDTMDPEDDVQQGREIGRKRVTP